MPKEPQMQDGEFEGLGEGRSGMIKVAVRGNGAILVNHEGVRFANEMLTRDKLSEAILSQTR